ncbi:hypothetical protein [Helicobacter cetorum]|uniref:hypothetical protein n=1 Tax=Helicobacter cetorum TaxID=138563 RepID=UPI000CF067B8|nr:hypothetical protein [Helicobacter cetorum]
MNENHLTENNLMQESNIDLSFLNNKKITIDEKKLKQYCALKQKIIKAVKNFENLKSQFLKLEDELFKER